MYRQTTSTAVGGEGTVAAIAPRQHAERRRLTALRRLALLDTPAEAAFDEVVEFAARALSVPMAAISLVDECRQWFKASVGLPVAETPRDIAFCHHVVISDDAVVVHDTDDDARFVDNPLVRGALGVRAYAGIPIHAGGEAVGTLCVLDVRTRVFDEQQLDTLRFLAHQVEHMLDLHARRSAEMPPPPATVARLAERLTAGETFEQISPGIDRAAWVFDAATLRIVAVNDLAVERYGWPHDEFVGRSILDIRPAVDGRVLAAALDNSQIEQYSASRTWRHRRADGELIAVRTTAADTVYDGRSARLVLVTDVTSQIAVGDALHRAAQVDSLTGLANRHAFIRELDARLASDGEASVAVLLVDLDRFKLVNDTMGHDTGDALLGAAAARIRQCTPADATVARLGGDEFAVIRCVADVDEAARIAEILRATLEHPFVLDEGDHYVSASVGVAVSNPDSTAQTLLIQADSAMYAAKDAGRNGYVVFDLALRERMEEWSETQRDLHRAIEHREIDLDVQPIVDLTTGAVSYEALARWNHPTRGRIGPAVFIPVAEESGLIRRLGDHLLELGSAHAAELGAPVSVNVSVRQFDRSLVQQVAKLIEQHHLEPGQLVIEITESAVVDGDHAAVVLAGLRAAGAAIWIDDFGTGYSSLGRLASLDVDGFKLPREFVNDLDSPHGWGIATAILGIARALDIEVIAEGVETVRQLDQVRELGCHSAQGFLLGRPRPFEQERAGIGAARMTPDGTEER